MDITLTSKQVMKYEVVIDGKSFEYDDLLETLHEIDNEEQIVITNNKMAEVFEKYAIASRGSSRWSVRAVKMDNFDMFYQKIKDMVSE